MVMILTLVGWLMVGELVSMSHHDSDGGAICLDCVQISGWTVDEFHENPMLT